MANHKPTRPTQIGLVSLLCAFVTYTILFSVLAGRVVSPLEGKGSGLVVILVLYLVFRLALSLAYWLRAPMN